jgi:hypothetical protein
MRNFIKRKDSSFANRLGKQHYRRLNAGMKTKLGTVLLEYFEKPGSENEATFAKRMKVPAPTLTHIQQNGHIPTRTVLRRIIKGLPESLRVTALTNHLEDYLGDEIFKLIEIRPSGSPAQSEPMKTVTDEIERSFIRMRECVKIRKSFGALIVELGDIAEGAIAEKAAAAGKK